MGDFQGYRQQSRDIQWGSKDENLTIDQINCGSLLRIADAAEHIAENHRKLTEENKWLSSSRKSVMAERDRLARSNAALRGVITKMKRIDKARQSATHSC
jgi:hypothetical protein